MKNLTLLSILFLFVCCDGQQKQANQQHIAICENGEGCEISEIKISDKEVDDALGKSNFWVNAGENATLILENCESKIEESLSITEIHQSYGGSGDPEKLNSFDIQKHMKEKGCFACPNATKKISFYASGEGHSGNGYFYLNLKAGEAYMPNEAFQQFSAGQEGANQVIVDQFIRNYKMEQYMIAEGKKHHHSMALGTGISIIQDDAINEQRFKNDFRKTGKTREHPNTNELETEYAGPDDEGRMINFWITPSYDVCLPPGKFDAFGFYNLGYISVDGITYLVTEISGPEFQIKLTGISEGSYNFNSSGYQSY